MKEEQAKPIDFILAILLIFVMVYFLYDGPPVALLKTTDGKTTEVWNSQEGNVNRPYNH